MAPTAYCPAHESLEAIEKQETIRITEDAAQLEYAYNSARLVKVTLTCGKQTNVVMAHRWSPEMALD